MIVYFLLMFGSFAFAILLRGSYRLVTIGKDTQEVRTTTVAAMAAFFPTWLVIGLRSGIADTPSYISSFNNMDVSSIFGNLSERNPGFDIMLRIFKRYISDDYHLWLMFLAGISLAFVIKNIVKYSPSLEMSMFLFYGAIEFSWLLNGARQYLAVCMLFASLDLIKRKKIIRYAIVSAIAVSIHLTAFVAIPAYFFVRGKAFNKKMILVFGAVLVATLFSSSLLPYLNEWFIEDSVYASYYDNLATSGGINIFRVLVAMVPLAFCVIYKRKVDEIDDPEMNICINMSLLNLALCIFASTLGRNLTGRLSEFYAIYNIILYPMIFRRLVGKNIYPLILGGFYVGYFGFFVYQVAIIWELGYMSDVFHLNL